MYSSKLIVIFGKGKSMKLEVKAAAIVAGIAVSSVVGILAVQLVFTYIPLHILGMFGALVIAGFFLSLLYSMVLFQLKNDKNIDEITKKYKVDQK